MIPQLLHWVWPHNTRPDDYRAALCQWREHHLAWRPIIWAPDPGAVATMIADLDFEVRALPLLVNHRLYSLLGCHGDRAGERDYPHEARAVIASVEIMARYGGVCPPIGALCTGSIEPLLREVRLFVRESETHQGETSEGTAPDERMAPAMASLPLYGALPNHAALWNVVRDLKNSVVSGRCGCEGISAASLVELVQFRLGRHPDLIAFPTAAFEVNPLCSML